MRGKRIVVGVTGGIATFKAAALVSRLSQLGADVRVIMTESATRFVTPLTFQTLSRNRVAVDTFDEQDPSVVSHIDLADHADLFVIAPATANILAKMAHGLGDEMLSTTLLATRAPVLVAPAMNVNMYQNPVVQENLRTLKERGVYVISPGEGMLACGYEGKGRMAEPEEIIDRIVEILGSSLPNWQGKRVVVTAGPTREPLDPVRYFTNRSSGKMGYAIAEVASRTGAEVVLISGPTSLTPPPGVRRINVTRAEEMLKAVLEELPRADIIIKAAAVADYRPATVNDRKIKKQDETIEIRMERTPDIALEVGKRKGNRFLVGFAAETDHVEENAREKLRRKGMDLIVANDVTAEGAGFEVDTNIATVYDQKGPVARWPRMSKERMAERLIALIGERLNDR
jgi:phosphopantothenoylcysteine decarboxylase / phosphopantothenate---cysteine ligase